MVDPRTIRKQRKAVREANKAIKEARCQVTRAIAELEKGGRRDVVHELSLKQFSALAGEVIEAAEGALKWLRP